MARFNVVLDEDSLVYFAGIDAKLKAIGASRAELARQLDMSEVQLSRLFTKPSNPMYSTILRIEQGVMTLRRRKAQQKRREEEAKTDGEA